MKLRHPFEWLSNTAQKRAFIAFLIFTFVVMMGLQVLDGPLKTKAAPLGIISFELAGAQGQAREIVESWGPRGRVYAGINLGLDYLFLVAYGICFGLGCAMVAQSLTGRTEILFSVGVFLSWGQIAAALLDSVENFALIRVLLGSGQELWPVVALWCAIPKFIAVTLGLIYILGGVVMVLLTRGRGRSEDSA